MTKPKLFEETIVFIAQSLRGYQYALRGTSSLALHGWDVKIGDVDIVCDKRAATDWREFLEDIL